MGCANRILSPNFLYSLFLVFQLIAKVRIKRWCIRRVLSLNWTCIIHQLTIEMESYFSNSGWLWFIFYLVAIYEFRSSIHQHLSSIPHWMSHCTLFFGAKNQNMPLRYVSFFSTDTETRNWPFLMIERLLTGWKTNHDFFIFDTCARLQHFFVSCSMWMNSSWRKASGLRWNIFWETAACFGKIDSV